MTEPVKDSWDSIEKSAPPESTNLLSYMYVLPNRESQKSQQEPINLMGGIGEEFQQQKKTCVVGRTPNFQNVHYLRSTYTLQNCRLKQL